MQDRDAINVYAGAGVAIREASLPGAIVANLKRAESLQQAILWQVFSGRLSGCLRNPR